MTAGTPVPAAAEPSSAGDVGSGHDWSRHNRIMVGVDGSPSADRALAWAIDEANRCGAELQIVSVWEPPDLGPEAYEFAPPEKTMTAMAAEQARRHAAEAARQAGRLLPAERVRSIVVSGGTAEMLVEQSKEADLLVVGSRGRGGFRGLLLGSVSQQCVTHAHCPVVVVRRDHHPSGA